MAASKKKTTAATAAHFPGKIRAATALRVLLTHAGVVDPHTDQPFSEAMVFGIGVAAFHYAKETRRAVRCESVKMSEPH